MNQLTALQGVISDFTSQVSLSIFIFHLFLAAVLSYGVGLIYIKYGAALSNRRAFANNFVLVALTTMLVISIVKTSLALSLGLIGALSIVRFRAAIKDPEELSYLFLAIAVGLGLGANQSLITIVTVITILGFLVVRRSFKQDNRRHWEQDLYLTISTETPEELTLNAIMDVLDERCKQSQLKRADLTDSVLETMFLVEFDQKHDLRTIEESLRGLDNQVKLTFLDSR